MTTALEQSAGAMMLVRVRVRVRASEGESGESFIIAEVVAAEGHGRSSEICRPADCL